MSDQWIVIPNWDRYQHYHDRSPVWIKDHLSQLDDDDYVELSFASRGLLADLRRLFAASDGRLPRDVRKLSNRLGARVLEEQLEVLASKGLVEFAASKPLALARSRARSREKRREEKKGLASALANQEPDREQLDEVEAASTNGELEPVGLTVDEKMLQLARGWLDEHGHPVSPPPNPFLDDE